MIETVRLWQTLAQSAKTGTSGYQTEDEFNRDLASVQTSLMGLLAPLYAKDITVQDLLSPFVKSDAISTTKPADYFQFVSADVSGEPSYPIRPNQVATYRTSPIRKPTAKNKLSYYYFVDDEVKFLTANGQVGEMIYLRQPAESKIELAVVSSDESDYIEPQLETGSSNLEWPERAFNLLLYLMMQKLGLSMKEQILLEISNLGIQTEASKL